MVPKFKLGDKVVTLTDCRVGGDLLFPSGSRGTVVHINKSNFYRVRIGEEHTWYEPSQLGIDIGDVPLVPEDIFQEVESLPKGGTKHDSGKPRCELLSIPAIMGVTQVLTFGAKKYSEHNWRQGLSYSRIIGAILRHLFAFMMGEDLDPDSGLPHIDHVACEVMFLQEFYRTRKDLDDRFTHVGANKAFKTFYESFAQSNEQKNK